ncbi:MAG: spore coat protein CotJB [Firmicutes bacterium]|nr:spore coat protein CotJB [Bacillota bacterium]
MDRDSILKRLTVLDFLAVDLQLYLDSHPDCKEGIKKYNEVVNEADGLREQYENLYGPLFSYRSYSKKDQFNWTDDPWPWEMCFNFDIAEKEAEN